MNKTHLLLGSNIGNSSAQIAIAKKYIEQRIGNEVGASSLYQTAAWGNTHQPDFINQVVLVDTTLNAEQCMETIIDIEKEMGRIRTIKNAPRVIDIDILFFNRDIINTRTLIIPHPHIQDRKFVLIPLNELQPGFIHPALGKSIRQLLKACRDELDVKKI